MGKAPLFVDLMHLSLLLGTVLSFFEFGVFVETDPRPLQLGLSMS